MTIEEEVKVLATRICELDRRLKLHVTYQQDAVRLAADALGTRLEHANGVIAQLKDVLAHTMPRVEITERFRVIDAQLQSLSTMNAWVAVIAGGIGGLLGVIGSWVLTGLVGR